MNPDFIIYLSTKAVLDEIFLRDLSKGLQKWKKNAIILHNSVKGPISQTWFQSKRISSHLSENMILNLPMSAKDVGLFKMNPTLNLQTDKLLNVFKTVKYLVLNSIVLEDTEEKILEPAIIIQEIRNKIGNLPLISFPSNPLSPLGQIPFFIETENDFEKLLTAYPEEKSSIEWLFSQKNVYFASPRSISML